jgi:superfamily II DNA or RNA helicase
MSEHQRSRPEHYSKQELIQKLLDVDAPPARKTQYDERYALLDDAHSTYNEFEEAMYKASRAVGIQVDQRSRANWQPNDAQLDVLLKRTENSRKRYRMIEGILQFEQDQEQAYAQRGVPLRPYQRESVRDFRDFIVHAERTTSKGGKSGLIEMPTGTGKTGIFANIASQLKHGEHAEEPTRVLVLVPTQTILNQTMGREGTRGFGKFAPHLDIGAYYQNEKELDREVVVMTNASFNNLMSKGTLPHFDAVIVDEAHTVTGDVTGTNIEAYCQDKISIGLTATPEYDEERSAYNLFKHKIHRMSFQHAVKTGKLAPVKGHLIDVDPEYDKFQLPANSAAKNRTKRQVELEARILHANKIIEDALSRGLGVLVRCPAGDDIDIAVEYANYLGNTLAPTPGGFSYRPVVADHVGGSYKRQGVYSKDEIFEDFNNAKVDVLTYVRAIGMGWDSPHAKVLVNLAPTTSAVEMRQAIGRIMRLIKDSNGKAAIAEVYDFRDLSLGKKQYTCLDALETKSGQLLAHDPNVDEDEEIIPTPRKFHKEITPEITNVNARIVGEFALNHAADAILPDNLEVSAAVNALRGDSVPIGEASRILGVSIPTLKKILFDVGSSPDGDIGKDELETILELYPLLYAQDVPETGYVLARDVVLKAPRHVRLLAVIPFARQNGINPCRFRGKDGKVGFYFTDEDTEKLIQLITDERRIATYKHGRK